MFIKSDCRNSSQSIDKISWTFKLQLIKSKLFPQFHAQTNIHTRGMKMKTHGSLRKQQVYYLKGAIASKFIQFANLIYR